MRHLRLLVIAITMALIGCTDPAPAPSPDPLVGSLVAAWREENDPVPSSEWPAGATLLTTAAERDAWVEALPADLSDERADDVLAVDLSAAVLIVGVWGNCRQQSEIRHEGDGTLRFRVRNLDDPPVVCAWSPLQVEVWQVTLAELDGVDRSAVQLAD